MPVKYILLAFIVLATTSLVGQRIETPAVSGPDLSASDLAWIQGIRYVKGLLPNKYGSRLKSVALILEYENGKSKTLIEPISIKYYDGELEGWKDVVGELLVSVRIIDGKHEFFLGYTTAEQNVQRKAQIRMRGVGLPGMTRMFQGRTGPMADDLSFVVPAGESELFTFVKDGKPFARVIAISEPVGMRQ